MSSQSFANLANSEFNGNIVLNNGYIKFPDNSIQTTAGGGGGGNVSTTTINTYTNTSVNNFQAATITCATQPSNNNSTNVANTAFVQTRVGTAGQFSNDNTGIGNNVFNNVSGSANSGYGTYALKDVTTGTNNTCIGYGAGNVITTSSFNTAIGFASLFDATGSNNTAIGYNTGENDETGSNNTYLGSQATQDDLDTHSYQYLTLIGADSEPINVGSDNQIVLGRLNGDDELFIPGNNIFLGNQNNISETYTIEASGSNSTLIFTAQPSVPTGYQNTLSLSTSISELTSDQITLNGDVTIPSPNNLIVNDIQFVNQNGDPGYTTNAVIYLNTTVTATQQLRCEINGTLYYINLTAV